MCRDRWHAGPLTEIRQAGRDKPTLRRSTTGSLYPRDDQRPENAAQGDGGFKIVLEQFKELLPAL